MLTFFTVVIIEMSIQKIFKRQICNHLFCIHPKIHFGRINSGVLVGGITIDHDGSIISGTANDSGLGDIATGKSESPFHCFIGTMIQIFNSTTSAASLRYLSIDVHLYHWYLIIDGHATPKGFEPVVPSIPGFEVEQIVSNPDLVQVHA